MYGDTIKINGARFDTVQYYNKIMFNGDSSYAISVKESSICTIIPYRARSGYIQVYTSTDTSKKVFFTITDSTFQRIIISRYVGLPITRSQSAVYGFNNYDSVFWSGYTNVDSVILFRKHNTSDDGSAIYNLRFTYLLNDSLPKTILSTYTAIEMFSTGVDTIKGRVFIDSWNVNGVVSGILLENYGKFNWIKVPFWFDFHK